MIRKKIINPERLRRINGSFSFIPHRFLTDGFLTSLTRTDWGSGLHSSHFINNLSRMKAPMFSSGPPNDGYLVFQVILHRHDAILSVRGQPDNFLESAPQCHNR